MPLTSDRMMAVIEAAERLVEGNQRMEKWILLNESPDVVQVRAAIASLYPITSRLDIPADAQAIITNAHEKAALMIQMFEGLTYRIRDQLRPSLDDIRTISTEAAHFRATNRHNASARHGMRKLRARRRADAEGFAEYGLNYNPPESETPRPLSRAEFDRAKAEQRTQDDPEFQKFQREIRAKYWPEAAAPSIAETPSASLTQASETNKDDTRAAYEREREARRNGLL